MEDYYVKNASGLADDGFCRRMYVIERRYEFCDAHLLYYADTARTFGHCKILQAR